MVKNSYTKLVQYNRDTKKGTLKCPSVILKMFATCINV